MKTKKGFESIVRRIVGDSELTPEMESTINESITAYGELVDIVSESTEIYDEEQEDFDYIPKENEYEKKYKDLEKRYKERFFGGEKNTEEPYTKEDESEYESATIEKIFEEDEKNDNTSTFKNF